MPLSFRCTGCRAKLHVPHRWAGGSVPCPKCGTRVVVPADPAAGPAAAFESRAVERSIAALQEPPREAPGGSFAETEFSLPPAPEAEDVIVAVAPAGVTVPRWVVYAALIVVVAAAAGGFLAGTWWAALAAK